MADADTSVTLDALHAAIETDLAARFPAFRTVGFYRDDESESIPTPALVLEMIDAEPAPELDVGTGQWPARLRFGGRVILSKHAPAAKLEARKAATALATYVYLKRWTGCATDEAQVIACEPDEFAPNVERFEVWRVEWVHLAFLGESVWTNEGQVPEALYSFVPDIGLAHKDDYRPLAEIMP